MSRVKPSRDSHGVTNNMVEAGQIWQNKLTKQQIRIKTVDKLVVVAEFLPGRIPIFLTVPGIEAEYQLIEP
jgi:hypothetical protein